MTLPSLQDWCDAVVAFCARLGLAVYPLDAEVIYPPLLDPRWRTK